MAQFIKNIMTVNGKEVEYFKVNHDSNGNPRYVIHFLAIDNDYNRAREKAREIGGKIYRAKWFAGGFVIQSYNLRDDLRKII